MAPETRTLGQLFTHIAVAQKMPEQIHAIERRTTLEGFEYPGKCVALPPRNSVGTSYSLDLYVQHSDHRGASKRWRPA
jgi:hypothetical protein